VKEVLNIQDLTIRYRVQSGWLLAVDSVSMTIHEGETVCLVGESGSGKSSVALAIPKLLATSAQISGEVVVEGTPVYQIPDKELRELRKKKISFIFQDPVGSLIPTATVGKQLVRTISYRMEISDKAECAERARELLVHVGLQDIDRVWHSYPFQLSGGMCQRVMIALALSVQPSLVIADEAVSALDAITQSRVLALLRDLQSEYGFGMVFVTHDLRVAAHVSTYVGVMCAGRLVELKPTAVLFQNAELQYSRQLIESAKELSL